jgi:hypothetical protein
MTDDNTGMTARADPDVPTRRVDAYLASIAAGLPGPRRRREAVLAELRDGLEQAADDHRARGLGPEPATAAAIAQFGDPRAVAAAFGGELATAYARRTIAQYLVTGPLVGIWWLLVLLPHPWPSGLVALVAAIPVLPVIVPAVVMGAGTIATTGRLMRWLPETGPRRALAATTAVAALALIGDLILLATVGLSGVPLRSVAAVAVAASLARMAASAVVLRQARRLRHAYR